MLQILEHNYEILQCELASQNNLLLDNVSEFNKLKPKIQHQNHHN